MKEVFIKVTFWVLIYIVSLGYVLPTLFSATSNLQFGVGVFILILLLYKTLTFIPFEKINKFLKDNM